MDNLAKKRLTECLELLSVEGAEEKLNDAANDVYNELLEKGFNTTMISAILLGVLFGISEDKRDALYMATAMLESIKAKDEDYWKIGKWN